MRILLLVGTGGFLGSVLRYLLSQSIQGKLVPHFPLGTLSVNLIGCFAIGAIFALTEKGTVGPEWRLFLVTGICGGFTTFSAFSIETVALLRGGQMGYAFMYVTASVVLGLAATFLAFMVFKSP